MVGFGARSGQGTIFLEREYGQHSGQQRE
jgi:hypothetical protein